MRIVVIVAGLFAALGTGAAALAQPAAPERHVIKEDEPRTGTRIRHQIVGGGNVPLNRTYAELTPEQQAIVKSQYEPMGPADEPPFPADGLGPLYQAIAEAQQKLRVTGPLSLYVEVDPQGRAVSVSVLKSPDPEMTRVAAAILMLQKYKPALCEGRPCTMQWPLRVELKTRW